MRAIVVALLASCFVGGALAYNCTWKASTGDIFELGLLRQWHQDYVGIGHTGFSYSINMCDPSRTTGRCKDQGYGVCQYEHTGEFDSNLGFWSGHQPVWQLLTLHDPRHGLLLTFYNGHACNVSGVWKPRTTRLYIPCDLHVMHPTGFDVTHEDHDSCTYEFSMPTIFGCPIPHSPRPYAPFSFRGTFEVTVAERNETFWVHEIYDKRKQRTRIDQFMHPGGWVTTLLMFDTHFRYSIINGSICHRHPLPDDLHMEQSIFDLYREHEHALQYTGISSDRGIHVDGYEGSWTFTDPRTQQPVFEWARWTFARFNWIVIENPSLYRRPVSMEIFSNRTHQYIHGPSFHHFTIMDFQAHVDAAAEREIVLEWWWNCPGGPPSPYFPPDTGKTGMTSGPLAGLSIFLILLGGAIGYGGHWYWLRRGGGSSSGFTTVGSSAASGEGEGYQS